jgi:hypothetical protein
MSHHFSKLFSHLNNISHDEAVEAAIYPTYGYSQGGSVWQIPLRGWVHQSRRLPDHLINELAEAVIGCDDAEISNFTSRFEAFTDDSRSGQEVAIEFDSDPARERYAFPKSDLNGLIEMTLSLSEAKAQSLLEQQGSSDGWLTFNVISSGPVGKGKVKLIEPSGTSLVSDIDDTIKVTRIPGDKDIVLKNTFCRDFVPVPGMAARYEALADASFHYVSGGPWQLFQPLNEFLKGGANPFPAGTFHLNYFPKNFLASDTRSLLKDSIAGSLGRTYDHKVEQITRLMERLRDRKFILVGDSGELDPEVYRRVRELFGERVQEIWIRDVVNDAEVNPYRLDGMNVIRAEEIVCATDEHFEKLAVIIQREHQRPYIRNVNPPCG